MQQGITKGLGSKRWSEIQWRDLIEKLVADEMVVWKDIAALTLGHLNPLQVGTSLASSEAMKALYGKGQTMKPVMEWLYKQTGRCSACGTRLELQVDHNIEETTDLNLMSLLCRRDNVIRRHALGGITDLTTESAVMWILLTLRPRTFEDFVRLCRLEGLTVSNVRFQEAWAMAVWLATESPSRYDLEGQAGPFVVGRWKDNAITRFRPGDQLPRDVDVLANRLESADGLAFVVHLEDDTYRYHHDLVSSLPFAVYDISPRPFQEIALTYQSTSKLVLPRPPRHCDLRIVATVPAGASASIAYPTEKGKPTITDVTGTKRKTFTTGAPAEIEIRVST